MYPGHFNLHWQKGYDLWEVRLYPVLLMLEMRQSLGHEYSSLAVAIGGRNFVTRQY
jgi:hypothetical protein